MQTKRRREIDILTPAEVDKLAAKMPAELARQRAAGGVVWVCGGGRPRSFAGAT